MYMYICRKKESVAWQISQCLRQAKMFLPEEANSFFKKKKQCSQLWCFLLYDTDFVKRCHTTASSIFRLHNVSFFALYVLTTKVLIQKLAPLWAYPYSVYKYLHSLLDFEDYSTGNPSCMITGYTCFPLAVCVGLTFETCDNHSFYVCTV